MIYLVVQLTYVPGHEAEGAEYERTVLAWFREHGGEGLGGCRPAASLLRGRMVVARVLSPRGAPGRRAFPG